MADPVEGVTKVAGDLINGFRGQPAMLLLVVLNCIGIGAGLWALVKVAETGDERFTQVLAYCFEEQRPRDPHERDER